jgi:hypothetical protein
MRSILSHYGTIGVLISFVGGVGCATPSPSFRQTYSSRELFQYVCESGKKLQAVKGGLRIKLNSEEISGQFNAFVRIDSPEQLRLEITNLLGGTEAWVEITSSQLVVTRTGGTRESRQISSNGQWGGIPLQRVIQLFLGQIPCPEARDIVSLDQKGNTQLFVKTQTQEYHYQIRNFEDQPWAESLDWKVIDPKPALIHFEFDDPEKETLSPKKWEAKSNQDRILVRWKNRIFEDIK